MLKVIKIDNKPAVERDIRKHLNYIRKISKEAKSSGNKFCGEMSFDKIGYCVTCKKNMPMKFAGKIQFKSGLEVFVGECKKCSTIIYKQRS